MSGQQNVQQIGPKNEYKIFLDKLIGKGQYGKVFECNKEQERITIQNLCAKITQITSSVEDTNEKAQQKRESEILKILQNNRSNQNIVEVYYVEYFEKLSKLVVVMEKCEMNLQNLIDQKKVFSQEEIMDFINQFINGYKALYDSDIIHRDLKPENILIKKIPVDKFQKANEKSQYQYKLADFGVGKIYKKNDMSITRIGTPIYSAPEINPIHQDNNLYSKLKKEKKCMIDMYSFGIILYQLVFNKLPFNANAEGIFNFFRDIKANKFKISDSQINQDIKNIIENALIYDPSNRLTFEQLLKMPVVNKNFQPIFQSEKQFQVQVPLQFQQNKPQQPNQFPQNQPQPYQPIQFNQFQQQNQLQQQNQFNQFQQQNQLQQQNQQQFQQQPQPQNQFQQPVQQNNFQQQPRFESITSPQSSIYFSEVKKYLQKQITIFSNLFNQDALNKIKFVLQQTTWNQNCDQLFQIFFYQPSMAQVYNEYDLIFFVALKCLKNSKNYTNEYNSESMQLFLSIQ